ncbi:CHAP-domain-containing protein [Trichocladium antarcticum]|uniref:CHAP-domain-containing protein n=1 Tax=Trichocladium antarcticum TaxID=1450529 RepID=A0AAN6ZGP3_9PEZI|nr:CHAP-domain-containing protein [Trichocladium antarcticum]
MKFAVFAAFFQAVAFSGVEAYPVTGNGVNCRTGPGTSFAVTKVYAKGTDVQITCQTEGTSVNGNSIWDKTTDGCYVADYYIKTGTNGYVTTKCPSSGGGGGIPGPAIDDYPYKGSCGGVDPWNYYKCQCTSFVAWRVNERLGLQFHNRYKGQAWGNANQWDDAARASGVAVDNTPKVGCIAQTNAGNYGHVAYVSAISGSSVTVEEYNYGGVEKYGKRTVPQNSFNYIHITNKV